VVNNTIVGETSKRSNVFLINISFSGGVVLDTINGTSTNSVDLLIYFSSVVITELTSSSASPSDCSWMPSSNTTDFSETSMSLSWESGDTESLDNTSSTMTSCYSNSVDHFIVSEDLSNSCFFIEVVHCKVNFLGDVSTVNLDFEEVSFLLSEVKFTELRHSEDSDNVAIFLYSF